MSSRLTRRAMLLASAASPAALCVGIGDNAVAGKPALTSTNAWELATVTYFHRRRGFGLLDRDAGGGDILVRVETLRALGISEIRKGQRLLVRCHEEPEGSVAAELTSPPTSNWEAVTLKWFGHNRYGWLTRGEGSANIFVEAGLLYALRLPIVQVGQRLQARYWHDPRRGLVATEVRPCVIT